MRGSGAPLHFIDVARPVARRISGERSPIQVKKAANEATKGISKGEREIFYIFTIITDVTHRNITLMITHINLPFLSRASYIFITFTYVARHGGLTRWRTIRNACEMS